MGSYSALAGGGALAVLMLPTVTLTAEGAMRMVPQRMKDAAIGMGCTNAQVVWNVTLPTALPTVVTGVGSSATGVYIRILSDPQLFIEGNHRTGALIMSYLLARASASLVLGVT